MKLRTIGLVFILSVFLAGFSSSDEPQDRPSFLDEVADYVIVKGPRTSSMIRSGTIRITARETQEPEEVEEKKAAKLFNDEDPDPEEPTEDPENFVLDIDYKLRIVLVGRKFGRRTVVIPKEYFSEEFIVKLREEGTYESEDFKVRHLGMVDAKLVDGRKFEQCDRLHFYDIKPEGESEDLEDSVFNEPQLFANIKIGAPVLGAVQFDMAGQFRGRNVKAGGDLTTPFEEEE